MESITERKMLLKAWVDQLLGQEVCDIKPLAPDASTRRYYRLITPMTSYIAVDAPQPNNNEAFIAIARALAQLDVQIPEVMSADIEHGFLLLTDFGDETFLRAFNERGSLELANLLYEKAMQALAKMQSCRKVDGYTLPTFDETWLTNEWVWHKEWFLQKWLAVDLIRHEAELDEAYAILSAAVNAQPRLFMHRDYHSANLMVLPDESIGVLDFQDAFVGPITYDLASLLRDCYITWPDEHVEKWVLYHAALLRQRHLLHVNDELFMRWFDWMSVQRHIKALMTFARKHVRDHQSQYLAHVPRTLHYIEKVCNKYPELNLFARFYSSLDIHVKREALCEQ